MALTPTPASTTDKTSIYFDAPLLMEHSPPEHQSGDNGVPHLASGTVESGDDEHPVEENGQVGRFHECDSNELAYVNGHWIHKQASSDDEPSIPRTASPDRYVASPTNGAQRDNLHTSDNEYPEGFAEGDVNENQERRSPIYANGTDVRADPAGPVASPDREENLHQRHASANASLTPKQRSKIVKTEMKEGKQLSKVIKKEGKIEKEAVAVAIKELNELQAIHKAALKAESKAHSAMTASLSNFQKCENAYNIARTKYEAAQAELSALEEVLETSKRNARDATEIMQEKLRDVNLLRTQKGVDDRERELKLVELMGKQKQSTLKRWL